MDLKNIFLKKCREMTPLAKSNKSTPCVATGALGSTQDGLGAAQVSHHVAAMACATGVPFLLPTLLNSTARLLLEHETETTGMGAYYLMQAVCRM